MLRLIWRDLGKTYGDRPVWRNAAGELESGEVLVVSGPNGSGKSTLLRLFAGLELPSAGAVYYQQGGATLAPRDMRPSIGMVAPDIALYRELTALEHLQFAAATRTHKWVAGHLSLDPAALLAQLAEVGLAGRERDRVANYSSGMALRLKYALALLHRPAVLLLDEPTAMFDEAGRALVAAIVATQRKRGLAVIATNDERELAWGDLVLRVDGGA